MVQTHQKFQSDCHLVAATMVTVYIVCMFISSLYATKWPVLPTCMQLILVSWYIASMLCWHSWMFSLSDDLLMQSYPSKVWFLCVAIQISMRHNLFVSYWSIFLHEIGGISWLTLWRCWLHNCWMLILIAEYDLVHRGDDKLWDTLLKPFFF